MHVWLWPVAGIITVLDNLMRHLATSWCGALWVLRCYKTIWIAHMLMLAKISVCVYWFLQTLVLDQYVCKSSLLSFFFYYFQDPLESTGKSTWITSSLATRRAEFGNSSGMKTSSLDFLFIFILFFYVRLINKLSCFLYLVFKQNRRHHIYSCISSMRNLPLEIQLSEDWFGIINEQIIRKGKKREVELYIYI